MGNKGGLRKKGSASRIALQKALGKPDLRYLEKQMHNELNLDRFDDVDETVRRCDVRHEKSGQKCIVPYYEIEAHEKHQAKNPKTDSWMTWPVEKSDNG